MGPLIRNGTSSGSSCGTFSFVSWNLQGLIANRLAQRTREVARLLLEEFEEPHVIHMQEVVPESEKIFRSAMPQYNFISAIQLGERDHVYHVMTGVHKEKCHLLNTQLIPFPNTVMGRKMLITEVCPFPAKKENPTGEQKRSIKFVNTHLESLPRYVRERLWQMRRVFEEMTLPQDGPVVLGGDLNIKDYEIEQVGGLPPQIHDAWISCGRDPAEEDTWHHVNQTYNDEIFPDTRFDRVFFTNKSLNAESFHLIKTRQLVPRDVMSYLSDHDGLLVKFRL